MGGASRLLFEVWVSAATAGASTTGSDVGGGGGGGGAGATVEGCVSDHVG